jgi:hypothetical protein
MGDGAGAGAAATGATVAAGGTDFTESSAKLKLKNESKASTVKNITIDLFILCLHDSFKGVML